MLGESVRNFPEDIYKIGSLSQKIETTEYNEKP